MFSLCSLSNLYIKEVKVSSKKDVATSPPKLPKEIKGLSLSLVLGIITIEELI